MVLSPGQVVTNGEVFAGGDRTSVSSNTVGGIRPEGSKYDASVAVIPDAGAESSGYVERGGDQRHFEGSCWRGPVKERYKAVRRRRRFLLNLSTRTSQGVFFNRLSKHGGLSAVALEAGFLAGLMVGACFRGRR